MGVASGAGSVAIARHFVATGKVLHIGRAHGLRQTLAVLLGGAAADQYVGGAVRHQQCAAALVEGRQVGAVDVLQFGGLLNAVGSDTGAGKSYLPMCNAFL